MRRFAFVALVALVLVIAAGSTLLGRIGASTIALAARPVVAATPSAIDVGFCQDMTTHHAQAILMAESVIGRADPHVRTLAIAILAGQSQESGTMRGWLAVWGAPQLASAPMAWMRAPDGAMSAMGADGRAMPGMATQADLARLASARGTTVDVTFLRLMLRHHEAGIAMATYAENRASSDLVRGLAAEMAVDQSNENLLMRRLLASYGVDKS